MVPLRWLPLTLAGFVAWGCDGYSKEQRQEMERIRSVVSASPGNVNAPDAQGNTPLHLAVLNNYVPLIDWLKDHGADPNSPGRSGERPLHVAVISDHSSDGRLILKLLRLGADVNAANDYGDTPLHRAAYLGLTEKVRLLLKNKADVSRRALSGETPLLYAARPEGYPDTVLALLEGGADVNAADNFGMTPLHGAAMIGDVDVARVLIEKGGAAVNLQSLAGYTPLHVAALSGKAEFVQFLLDNGADRELQDHDNLTPAERAARFPAITASKDGSHPIDTSAAVTILRTHSPHPK
jgi:ankyrin repeat protein